MKIWQAIGRDFLTLTENELALKLKSLGYRFYNKRANYIILAREKINGLNQNPNNDFRMACR
jgi:N-glycosylase/DNA lyase